MVKRQRKMESVEIAVKISVCGLGFVGLTTALGFADKGFCVHGYDENQKRAAIIKNNRLPFAEPGLDTALVRNNNKTFFVADSAADAAKNADAVFFCVGTPFGKNGKADLTHIFFAIDSMIDAVKSGCVFVIKSTVPPKTTSEIILPYLKERGFTGSLANNPEFLREGFCWDDFVNADRIVCGINENDTRAVEVLDELYKPFGVPLHFVSHNTAEFIKYLSNSMLATMISFANEMSLIADAVGGIETAGAFKILHEDKRLAGSGISGYIYPGCGFGGYCLPKDTAALEAVAKSHDINPRVLSGVISLNNEMPKFTAKKIINRTNSKDEKIGILGLSFKPESDDVRDSSAAKIVESLNKLGYHNIYAFDPVAVEMFKRAYMLDVTFCASANEVCEICETVAIVTAWDEFAKINEAYPNVKWVDCRYFL